MTHRPSRAVGCAVLAGSLLLTAGARPATGQDGAGGSGLEDLGLGSATDTDPVELQSLVWSKTGVRPGEQLTLGVVLRVEEPFHVNAHEPDDPSLIPTEVEVLEVPEGFRASTPVYPEPHRIPFGPPDDRSQVPVYSGQVVVYVPMAVAPGAEPGERTVRVRTRWQACDDQTCLLPEEGTREAGIEVVAPDAPAPRPHRAELFEDLQQREPGGDEAEGRLRLPFFGWDFEIDPTKLWLLLPLAAVGGFLLNLTPCVLPLIPIKIMGLSKAAGDRARCLLLGGVMSLGVVAFWLGLGAAISTVSGFTSANQLFQEPWFTIGVGVVIAAMALGMCGLFVVQLPQSVHKLNPSQETIHGSFLFGVMTAVLSTPCTAPFMGAAAAWAATQTPAVTLGTFVAIGCGMALPYLLLAAFPGAVRRMPRAGPAGELIKQTMGLFMLAAAAYFCGTGLSGLLVEPPDPPSRAYWWAVGGLIAAAGLWLAWRTFRITSATGKRLAFGGLGLAFVGLGVLFGVRFTSHGPVDWIYYTPERLAEAQEDGKVVVLEFTAEWCLNCKALEEAVLHHPEVARLLNGSEVAPIKVDITGNNEAGNAKLNEVGRRTIPYLIVYGSEGRPVFDSDAYTRGQLLKALRSAVPEG